MMVVGLTGGVGSGKSTVSTLFGEMGVRIIDADKIAHQLVQAQQPALEEIKQYLGDHYLTPEGELNRRLLREHIFLDPSLKEKLESILHPKIYTEIKKQVDQIKNAPGYCIVVIPLLVKNLEKYDWLHRILLIDTSVSLQIQRTKSRDRCEESTVQKMIEAQIPREENRKIADDIIDNTGDICHLKDQVFDYHKKYTLLAKQY